MKVRVGHCSDRGRRENNEDNFFVDPEQHLFMVADGMGGQAAGEIASQLAVDIIPKHLAGLPDAITQDDIRRCFYEAFLTCNEAILARGAADPTAQNLGTTAVIMLLRDKTVTVAHIGDSRCYRLRQKKLELLTSDHNLAQALYIAKTINEEELKNHRYRNVLYKYLGMKDAGIEPDISFLDLRPGDRFLLASDGVTGSLSEAEMTRELGRRSDPGAGAGEIVRLAIENGSKDNATGIVVFIDDA
jgi:protein phosphatase